MREGTTSAQAGPGPPRRAAATASKEANGWSSLPLAGDRHEVLITTPTGHTYVSTAPDPPRPEGRPPDQGGDVVHFYSEVRTLEEELQPLLA